MNIKNLTAEAADKLGISLNETQLEQFEIYYKLLVDWNNRINLTAITDSEGVAVKHFVDSLSVLKYVEIPFGASVIDVGTGAGFPGLALKIARPDVKLTLLDSLQKRLNFLEAVLAETDTDAKLIHSRAEDGGQSLDLRESFDIAVSRAVAQMNILSEYCLPYVRLSGRFVAFKGPDADGELDNAKKAIGILGGKLEAVHKFDLPLNGGGRTLAVVEKNRPTPDRYPRNAGKMKAKPL